MIKLTSDTKIYFCTDIVDMRKSIDGLSVYVFDTIKCSPKSGHIFIFCNRTKDKLKCLYWDRNGYALHYKRLEKHKFKLKQRDDGVLGLDHNQLSWLLAGLDFDLMSEFTDLNYEHYY